MWSKERCCVFLLAGGRQLIFRELSGRQLSSCWCIVIAVCAAERAERSIKDPSQLLPCHSAGRFIIAIIFNIYGIFCQPPQSHLILHRSLHSLVLVGFSWNLIQSIALKVLYHFAFKSKVIGSNVRPQIDDWMAPVEGAIFKCLCSFAEFRSRCE